MYNLLWHTKNKLLTFGYYTKSTYLECTYFLVSLQMLQVHVDEREREREGGEGEGREGGKGERGGGEGERQEVRGIWLHDVFYLCL